MKTISDIHATTGSNPEPTHIFDRHTQKVYDAATHRHLLKVRDDMAAGRTVWVPRKL